MLQTAKKIVRKKPPTNRAGRTPRALKFDPLFSPAPDKHALWSKYDGLVNRLQDIARKADLLAWALEGVMALEENDSVWPIQDGAFEIKDALEHIAEEVRL